MSHDEQRRDSEGARMTDQRTQELRREGAQPCAMGEHDWEGSTGACTKCGWDAGEEATREAICSALLAWCLHG